MTKVICNALKCGYNDCNKCKKNFIEIEGLFAKDKIATFCYSFNNPYSSKLLQYEFAKEMNSVGLVKVKCSANNCIYNNSLECIKDEIKIGRFNSLYRSETECDSFKIK